jgi:hypothetical protein
MTTPTPLERDLLVLEQMQAKLFGVWTDLLEQTKSDNPRFAAAALSRLAAISRQLQSVTREHALLAAKRPPTQKGGPDA